MILEHCRRGHFIQLKEILKTATIEEINQTDKEGKNAVIWASCGKTPNHTHCLELLLEQNVSVTQKDSSSQTALEYCCRAGNYGSMQLLMNAGFGSHQARGKALIRAAGNGRIDCVKALLETKCELENRDCLGRTALAVACENGQIECVRLLLAAGSKIKIFKETDFPSRLRLNPLYLACSQGHHLCVEELINAGATLDFDFFCNCADLLLIAAKKNYLNIVKLLIEKGFKVKPNHLVFPSRYGHVDCVKEILKCNLDFTNYNFLNAVTETCRFGRVECLRAFIEAGFTETNYSPISFACVQFRQIGCLEEMLYSGVYYKPKNGEFSVLFSAACSPHPLACNMVQLLLDFGFDKSLTYNNQTLLEYSSIKKEIKEFIENYEPNNNLYVLK